MTGSGKTEFGEAGVLEFIAEKLAVPLPDISKYFSVPEDAVKGTLAPLVKYGFVKEQRPGWYSITANGVMRSEQSAKAYLADYL
jgi:predicted transcriptional regulator